MVLAVALVAIVIILKSDEMPSFSTENLFGRAAEKPAPYIEVTLKEGETETLSLGSDEFSVTAVAVVASDWTGKPSAAFTLKDLFSYRVYEGGVASLATEPMRYAITVMDVVDDTVTIRIGATSLPPRVPPRLQDAIVMEDISLKDTRTYPLNNQVVDLTFADYYSSVYTASFIVGGESATAPLRIGMSGEAAGVVITLVDIFTTNAGKTIAIVNIAFSNSCGSIDAQTLTCRGGSACCGGTCRALPVCGKRNGPVESCGARQLYCCDQVLTFAPCADTLLPGCLGDSDCDEGFTCRIPPCAAPPGGTDISCNGFCAPINPAQCEKDADCQEGYACTPQNCPASLAVPCPNVCLPSGGLVQ